MSRRVLPRLSFPILALLVVAGIAPGLRARGGTPPPIGFSASNLADHSSSQPTCLQFGPDGRLYVSDIDGTIHVYGIVKNGPGDYVADTTETIDIVKTIPNHDDDGTPNAGVVGRQVTGMVVAGTVADPVIYVSSADPRPLGLDSNSGVLSKLTQATSGTWVGVQKQDLVRGLPSAGHHPNGLALSGDENTLFLAQGGFTNMGASASAFQFYPEYALCAAILSIDLVAIGATTYDLPTLDDPFRPGDPDPNDPFGGNFGFNQGRLVDGGPVQVHAPGFRNPYDILIASDGRMYTIDNGPNDGGGDVPLNEGPGGTCLLDVQEGGTTYDDGLHYVRQLTQGVPYYGGHPNPTRANPALMFAAAVDPPLFNAVECDYRVPGSNLGAGEDGSLVQFPTSTNGLCEYTATNFECAMQGDILAVGWNPPFSIFRTKITYDAFDVPTVQLSETLISGIELRPLDIIARSDTDPFPGTIWVAVHFADLIKIYEPQDTSGCTGADDPLLDEDGDGYKNDDEIDNGTDPCSGADVPPDADGDFVSDLNDRDDDNDGTNDLDDDFAVDPDDGEQTVLFIAGPSYGWDPGDPALGGLLELGFTGLMRNGTTDYLDQYDPANMTTGGAPGLVTIDMVPPGDALGGTNTQEYGFQFGVNSSIETRSFTARTRILVPFTGITPAGGQSMGLFVGTGDQDNYVKITVAANGGAGGVEVVDEQLGAFTVSTVAAPVLGAGFVDLALGVDPVAMTVQPAYSVDGGAEVAVGSPIPIPLSWLDGPEGLAVGIIATSAGATPFTVNWDFIEVTLDCDDPADTVGAGLAGYMGQVPELSTCGLLSSGNSGLLSLRRTIPSSLAYFFYSFNNPSLPFKGGILVPADGTILALTTDAHGRIEGSIPGGGGPVALYVQFVIPDPEGPQGFALSNALRLDFLP